MNDKHEPYAKIAKLYESEIARSHQERSASLKSWITALSVGNGAGLFGIFSATQKSDAAMQLYLLLPSAWLFIFGLAAASACAFAQVAFHAKDEEFWRLSDVNRIHDENEWPAFKSDEELDNIDSEAKKWAYFSGCSGIVSSLAFLAAVAIPLARITYRAMFGIL